MSMTDRIIRYEFGYNEQYPAMEPLFPAGANRLFCGDNLALMHQLPSECIDLIYIDPPFFTGRDFNILSEAKVGRSFSDIWDGGMLDYVLWLSIRLAEMKRLLKPNGSIYVHLDWHAVHYIKVEMDKIFGANCFQNELIWHYQTGGASKVRFSRKHDTILWYSRSPKDWKFYGERIKTPRTPKSLHRARNPLGARISQLDTEKNPNDVLILQQMNPMAKERVGYPTQKPEALLEMILLASSDEGDTIADFFCGSGTTPVVAQRLARRWLSCDESKTAIDLSIERLACNGRLGIPTPDFTVEVIEFKSY